MKNINKIVYYLLIASANIFLTTAQQFTIDLNKKSCAKEGIIEVELSGENPDSLGVLRYYQLNLPNYDKAVYYAQDTYYDYWQVNGNRVLPWIFTPNTIGDLFVKPAYGVDDQQNLAFKNAGFKNRTRYVSRSGCFMQTSLKDGNVLALLPLANSETISDLYVTDDGKLIFRVANYGTQSVSGKVPVLAWSFGSNTNEASYLLFSRLLKHDEYKKTMRLRYQKDYPEMFKYLGWCTWEQYKKDINSELLKNEIIKLKTIDLPIRYAIIDDGHLSSRSAKNIKNQLTSFLPNDKFPQGFSPLLSLREPDGLKWMGLWQNFNGYWGGFSPVNNFGNEINQCLQTIEKTGYTMPRIDSVCISKVYHAFLGQSASDGFDFLKVDWQAANLYMQRYSENAARGAFLASRIVDDIADRYFSNGLINCMAMNNAVLQNTYHTNVTRTSIDYKLNNMFMAKEHLLQSYHNALYICPTVWGDHDMFHSSDKVCGDIMALSKAMSGGPVYLSDAPDQISFSKVSPLCYDDGLIIRPLAPATVMERSVFTAPLIEQVPYYVSAPLENGVAAVVIYNLCVDSVTVSGTIDSSDYSMTGTLLQPYSGKWKLPEEGLFLYDYDAHTGYPIGKNKHKFQISGFDDKLYFFIPIYKGWAIIGRTDKYLSPATVSDIKYKRNSLELTLSEAGIFDFWMKEGTPYAENITFTSLGNGIWRANAEHISNNRIIILKK
ncbi:Sip1-related alpha-galactosidase [Bacteroides salyersiae]|uniref:Sip1-related alpha-galactosidase n=2 Tax=Bacteroides TaxID=816 RepID=UPI00222078D6|nr:Sip1-related alpha-galactosidase [Bacteroides salyersiae]UYU46680.1 hypothetical protein KQP70_09355 [Bacteroides salyersiae]